MGLKHIIESSVTMISTSNGNLFTSSAQVLVNPVNTVGVMGKGLALDFKRRYPAMFEQYRFLCQHNQFNVGQLWLYRAPDRWILNFPTKTDWRQPAKLEYIEAGLSKFVATYQDKNITSIAFPQLGSGNGGLDWATMVSPLMEHYLSALPIVVEIHSYSK